jgi:apolipoprotein N-acyltransferase
MNFGLAVVSALLLILCFPRFDATWLAPFALAPMLVAVAREARPLRRFLFGWAAGAVYWFGVCYWIQFVLAVHGGLGEAGGWAVFLLFCVAKALHMAVFALLAGVLMRGWWAAPGVAALWTAIEATHGSLGFAWLALGNAGVSMGIPMRLAPYTGVYGLSFLFALMAATLALAALRRPRRELAWLLALPLLLLPPAPPPAQAGRESAVLLQPAISESERWTRQSLDQQVERMVRASAEAALTGGAPHPSLIVWPEAPAPFYYYEDLSFRSAVDHMARATGASVLAGVVAHMGAAALNSAVLVSPEGAALTRYDKVNLVPFGEFVPWPFGFANKISTEVGDFTPGKRVVVSPVGAHRIGAFICYESVFPSFVRQFARGGAEALFNLSNDGYFGKTAAREQHLAIVRMRAAENRRWIVRATNDGVTAAIDPAGRVNRVLAPYTAAAATAGFNYESTQTLYTRWGDWLPVFCGTLALLLLLFERATR